MIEERLTTKRVYLAGPDVFYRNAKVIGDELKALCSQVGLVGLFPLDSDLSYPPDTPGHEIARLIFEANEKLIRSADGVLADMVPFRGPSMDVGTAWEVGFAYALGKPIVGYSDKSLAGFGTLQVGPDAVAYKDRVSIFQEKWPDDMLVEDFGLTDNLMIDCSLKFRVYDSRSRALKELAKLLTEAGHRDSM